MTKLTLAEVENIAHLARLTLTDEEKHTFQDQLSAILGYAELLDALDTSDIAPTTSALPLHTVMRPDLSEQSLSIEDVLLNAPDHAERSFRVKPIF